MNFKYFRNIAFLALALLIFSCAQKKETHDDSASHKEWKEMDDFHMVMAETFHPYKDSANLEPVKTQADELAASAESWANASLPEKVNNDAMKSKLGTLKAETAALVETVNAGDDQAIADQLTKVHDLFHTIQEGWYGGDEEHGHQH